VSTKPRIFQTVVAKGLIDTNCYLVGCPRSGQAAVIDPGAFGKAEIDAITGLAEQHRLQVKYIINTHGHIDHIAADRELRELTGAMLLVHREDAPLLESPLLNGSLMFGFKYAPVAPDRMLEDGDIIPLGDLSLTVIHTPGHTAGGITLLVQDTAFAGDTLFAGSVGRTDLPGGHDRTLLRSIRERLLSLPDATAVRPGHGPRTTIGKERKHNPFLK
jgi:glyoxylase-like metal-dependent hydrolase (beta-lactamase superfamily II)